MQQPMRHTQALEPRAQSTRVTVRYARGYHPTPAPGGARVLAAVLRSHKRMHGLRSRPRLYSGAELYIAFLGGIVLAACALTFLHAAGR